MLLQLTVFSRHLVDKLCLPVLKNIQRTCVFPPESIFSSHFERSTSFLHNLVRILGPPLLQFIYQRARVAMQTKGDPFTRCWWRKPDQERHGPKRSSPVPMIGVTFPPFRSDSDHPSGHLPARQRVKTGKCPEGSTESPPEIELCLQGSATSRWSASK